MTRNRWFVVVAIVAALASVLVLAMRPSASGGGDIGNAEARDLMDAGARIIDVRTPAEFAMGRIPGAENVPLADLSAVAAGWDPAEPVLIYCATGNRSVTAMDVLQRSGFTSVYNLTAGIAAWDGDVVTGEQAAVPPASDPAVSGLPVMYEFYTDW